MPDNLMQGITSGGIGGIIGTLLAFFGFKERLDKLEANSVLKDTCKTCSDDWKGQLNRMHDDIKIVVERLDKVLEKL